MFYSEVEAKKSPCKVDPEFPTHLNKTNCLGAACFRWEKKTTEATSRKVQDGFAITVIQQIPVGDFGRCRNTVNEIEELTNGQLFI